MFNFWRVEFINKLVPKVVINGRVNWKCRIDILPHWFSVHKVIGDTSTGHFLILDEICEVGNTQAGYLAQKNQTFIEQFSYENQIKLLFHKMYNLVGGRMSVALGDIISQTELKKIAKIFSPMTFSLSQYVDIVGDIGNKLCIISIDDFLEPKIVKKWLDPRYRFS